MRLDITKYNAILSKDEESIIGYSDDIIKLYKGYIKQLVDDMDDAGTIEDLKSEIDMILDMLFNIYAKNELCGPELLKVDYNPMGAYVFKVLKEEE